MIYIQVSKEGGRSGHLAKDQLTGVILKHLFGFEFVFTPTNDFVDRTLGFSQLGAINTPQLAERTINQTSYQGLSWDQVQKIFAPYANVSEDLILKVKGGTRIHLFQVYEWETKGLLKSSFFKDIRSHLRGVYARKNRKKKQPIEVAVHIRRGDIALYTQSKWARFSSWSDVLYSWVNSSLQRWRGLTPHNQHYCFPVQYYQNIMNQLRDVFNQQGIKYHFSVLSESENSVDLQQSFSSLDDISLQLDGSLDEDFQSMVDADILVTSNSSFSQLAGYYSQGLKIYHPCDQFQGLGSGEFIAVDAKGNLSNTSHPLISRLKLNR